jgi:hypothetical protein
MNELLNVVAWLACVLALLLFVVHVVRVVRKGGR